MLKRLHVEMPLFILVVLLLSGQALADPPDSFRNAKMCAFQACLTCPKAW